VDGYGRGVNLTSGLLVRGLRRRDLYALDAVLAAALCFASALSAIETPASGGWHEPVGVSLLTAVLIGAPIALRRLWPVPVVALSLAISAAALVSGVITDYASGSMVVVLACELYLVGSEVAARSVPAVVVTTAVLGVALILSPGDQGSLIGAAFACLLVAGVWVLGRVRRERRQHATQVAEQRTQHAVADERLRIARELHDIVAHSMSLIAVRAAVADHVFGVRPAEARSALRDIEAASRSALSQLRQAVEVLREEDADYAPAPGLADLPALAARVTAGGVSVRLTVEGSEAIPRVPEAVGLSAFRIVQEALTNAVKHAAPATCTATVTVAPAEVRIRVADDGAPLSRTRGGGYGRTTGDEASAGRTTGDEASAGRTTGDGHGRAKGGGHGRTTGDEDSAGRAGGDDNKRTAGNSHGRTVGDGHGLIGMRERVAAWGGEFSAGPGEDSGFVVTATLPYRDADS
jgi:signal transduction histidine kinase